jgi:hypothetical protein
MLQSLASLHDTHNSSFDRTSRSRSIQPYLLYNYTTLYTGVIVFSFTYILMYNQNNKKGYSCLRSSSTLLLMSDLSGSDSPLEATTCTDVNSKLLMLPSNSFFTDNTPYITFQFRLSTCLNFDTMKFREEGIIDNKQVARFHVLALGLSTQYPLICLAH